MEKFKKITLKDLIKISTEKNFVEEIFIFNDEFIYTENYTEFENFSQLKKDTMYFFCEEEHKHDLNSTDYLFPFILTGPTHVPNIVVEDKSFCLDLYKMKFDTKYELLLVNNLNKEFIKVPNCTLTENNLCTSDTELYLVEEKPLVLKYPNTIYEVLGFK